MLVTITFEGEEVGRKAKAMTPKTRMTTMIRTPMVNQIRRRGGGWVGPPYEGGAPPAGGEAVASREVMGPEGAVRIGPPQCSQYPASGGFAPPQWEQKVVSIPNVAGRERYLGASSWSAEPSGEGLREPLAILGRESGEAPCRPHFGFVRPN